MTGLGLVIFHRNEPDRVAANVRRFAGVVDETLIVDSSDAPRYETLLRQVDGTDSRVVRVLPVGTTELLRPLAHQNLQSDWVVSIDADEEPSDALLDRLRQPLDPADAFEVPRWESSLGVLTWHRRIYRREAVDFSGWIHETPWIRGRVERLAPESRLVHHANYTDYLNKGSRQWTYVQIEALERPFTPSSLRREFAGSRLASLLFAGNAPLARPTAWMLLAAWGAGRRWGQRPGAGSSLLSRYFGDYLWARYRYFYGMSKSARSEAARIAAEAWAAGGPIRYLGFENPGYVASLTSDYSWDREAGAVLETLLRYRHQNGKPLSRWGVQSRASS